MKLLSLVLIALTATVCVCAEPALEPTPLFEADQNGYKMCRIPGLVVTAKGTVLAYCEARKSDGDWVQIDVMIRRGTDNGKTWSAQHKIADFDPATPRNPLAKGRKPGPDEALTTNNPVAISARDGTVHFLCCLEYMRCFYMRSEDDGVTFSKPVEITSAFNSFRPAYDWKVLATGPGHGIEMKNGRLLVPVWLSTGTGGNAHRPSALGTIYSDDKGATWHAGAIVTQNPDPLINPNETSVVQLIDGRILLNIRSESKANRRAISTSPDGGSGWTKPEFIEELKEPVCFGSMVRLSETPSRILFCNPDNLEGGKDPKPGSNRTRKNLTVKMSQDEGKTWPVSKVIDPGISGYSDLAVLPDGTALCLYESTPSGGNMFHTKALVLVRFTADWMTGN